MDKNVLIILCVYLTQANHVWSAFILYPGQQQPNRQEHFL